MRGSPLLARLIRFAAVGAVGTAGHYLTLIGVVEGLGGDPVAGSVAGFLVGALINYSLNRAIVFRSGRAHREALPRFLTVAGLGLVWNGLLMSLFTHVLGLHYLLAQVLATALLLFWHYAGNALWTFAERPSGR